MSQNLTVTFDGEVFHPDQKPDLKPNTRYLISILSAPEIKEKSAQNAWDILEDMAGQIEASEDWSSEHDHYLYGTPKQHLNNE